MVIMVVDANQLAAHSVEKLCCEELKKKKKNMVYEWDFLFLFCGSEHNT